MRFSRPAGIGICRDVEVHDLSSIVPKHDENVQHSKCSGRHGEEIARDDVRNVIIEERSPSLGRFTGAKHVLGYRPLGDLMSQ